MIILFPEVIPYLGTSSQACVLLVIFGDADFQPEKALRIKFNVMTAAQSMGIYIMAPMDDFYFRILLKRGWTPSVRLWVGKGGGGKPILKIGKAMQLVGGGRSNP